MWICHSYSRQFENTCENSLWRKMHPIWLCNVSASHLRTHLKTHSGEKLNKCNQFDLTSVLASNMRRHLKNHSREKSHKCTQCDYATVWASHLSTHLKTHSGEKWTNICNYALCTYLGKQSEKTSEKLLWKKTQTQAMWLCLYSCELFQNSFSRESPIDWV